MAVAVKTTAIKASAMDGSEALFRDGIEPTRMDVSNNTVPTGSVELPRNKPDATRCVSEQEHCTKNSLWGASQVSYTEVVCGSAMKIDSANAQPMGSLIFEGGHKPFHALACPLRPAAVRIISRKA